MKNHLSSLGLVVVLVPLLASGAGLSDARQLMRENQPAKAAETIQQMQAQRPGDVWLTYDLGVAAYAAKEYDKAEQIWQELATRELPDKLRDKVWTQIGNVSFRKGEPLETSDPQATLQLWEQSREAYRIYLVTHPKDKEITHNLKVVEDRLAKLHARLAQDLLKEAQRLPLEPQIEKMQAALDHQRTAENLDPKSEHYQRERQQTEQKLAENYVQKAGKEEKRTDNVMKNPNANTWERKNAEEQLRMALSDFQEAKALDEKNQAAAQGEERVKEKLAQLLARDGAQLQKEAKQEEDRNADAAEGKYEQALEKYEQALALKPEQPEAKQGEKEVKEALEQLHMREGDRQARQGEQDMKNKQESRAAANLTEAMNHYQEALKLNPENQEAPPKIAQLEKIIPPLLNSLAEHERKKAAEQEPKSLEKAIAHMEKAATSFQKSAEIQPEQNEQAKQGEEQSRQDLARMRQQLAQRNQQQAKQEQEQEQAQKEDQQNQESFYSMLRQVKKDDKQREYEQSRRAPTEKYDPDQNRIYKNW